MDRTERLERLVVRLRNRLEHIVDGMADEGDRVYFGSSNDADDLRQLWREMDALRWDRILAKEKVSP